MSVVNISKRVTLIDVDDQSAEFHLASLCVKQVSDFKIRYTSAKDTPLTIIELLLASEEITDQGGDFFNSVKKVFCVGRYAIYNIFISSFIVFIRL